MAYLNTIETTPAFSGNRTQTITCECCREAINTQKTASFNVQIAAPKTQKQLCEDCLPKELNSLAAQNLSVSVWLRNS